MLTRCGAIFRCEPGRRRARTIESRLDQVHQRVVQQHGVPGGPINDTVEDMCHNLALSHVSGEAFAVQ